MQIIKNLQLWCTIAKLVLSSHEYRNIIQNKEPIRDKK